MFIAGKIRERNKIIFCLRRLSGNFPVLKACILSLFFLLLFIPPAAHGETYRISAGGRIRMISWPENDSIYFEVINGRMYESIDRSTIKRLDLSSDESGHPFFSECDILDWKELNARLKKGETPEIRRIVELLDDKLREQITEKNAEDEIYWCTRDEIITGFEKLCGRKNLFDNKIFNESKLNDRGMRLLKRGIDKLDNEELYQFNRYLIESAFPDIIAKRRIISLKFEEDNLNRSYFLEPTGRRTICYDSESGEFIVEEAGEVLLKKNLGFRNRLRGNFAIEGEYIPNCVITPILNREDLFLSYHGRWADSPPSLLSYSFQRRECKMSDNFDMIRDDHRPYVFDHNEGNYFSYEMEIFSFNPFDDGKKVIYKHETDFYCPILKVRARDGILYFAVSKDKTLYCQTLYTLFSYDIKTHSLKKLHSDIDDFILSKNLIALREFKITNPSNSDGIHTLKIFDKDGKQLLSKTVDDRVDYIISPSEDKIALVKYADPEYYYLVSIIDIPGR